MGVDTKGKLTKPGIPLQDVVDYVKTLVDKDTEVKVELGIDAESQYYNIDCTYRGEKRCLHIHTDLTEEGNVPGVLLSLRCWSEGPQLVREVVQTFGGFFCYADTDNKWEAYDGLFREGNGIPYHYRYAIVNGYMRDENDIEGFFRSVRDWYHNIGLPHGGSQLYDAAMDYLRE